MKILLVDDEKLQLSRLLEAVKSASPDAEPFPFSNPMLALEEAEKTAFDVAFLDIEMPGITGISLAKKLKDLHPSTNIVFVTAYEHYALESFKLRASGYVLKPVNEAKVRDELSALRYPVELKPTKKLQIKCFGNFEVFYEGKPLAFSYNKSKELFAYLVDREGAFVSLNELNAVLWEEDHMSYLRNLVSDIQSTLKSIGAAEVFLKRRGECAIDIRTFYCDAYEYRAGNPDAINLYRGEYMIQYPWAHFDH